MIQLDLSALKQCFALWNQERVVGTIFNKRYVLFIEFLKVDKKIRSSIGSPWIAGGTPSRIANMNVIKMMSFCPPNFINSIRVYVGDIICRGDFSNKSLEPVSSIIKDKIINEVLFYLRKVFVTFSKVRT